MKIAVLGMVLSMLIVASSFAVFPVKAMLMRVPGVHVGDWAEYDLTGNYTTNDPNPPMTMTPEIADVVSYRIEILSISGTNVTAQLVMLLRNGTEISNVMWTDVSGTGMMGTPLIIAANLTAGDLLSPSPGSIRINETLMRTYAGAEREANYVGLTGNSTFPGGYLYAVEIQLYWDRISGIVDELIEIMQFTKAPDIYTYVYLRLAMKETNMWSPAYISVKVNFTPESLNLRSNGEWILCIIRLPEGYVAKNVDRSSIKLNDTLLTRTRVISLGAKHLLVRLDRAQLIQLVLNGVPIEKRLTRVTLTISGKFKDGTPFQGSDSIRVLLPRRLRSCIFGS